MTLLGFERRWLLLIFRTVAPFEGDGSTAGLTHVPMGELLDDLVRNAPAHFLLGLRACLWVVMLAPPFVLGRLASFVTLAREERLALLERLGQSDIYVIREMPMLFKTVACLGYCGLPEVQRRVGIHPTDATPPSWARRGLPMAGPRT